METDAWITRDDVVVLDHDGVVTQNGVTSAISDMGVSELPKHIPTLADYYAVCGTQMELSVDVKDPAIAAAIIAVARGAGGDAEKRLWLCGPTSELPGWRALSKEVHLVAGWDPALGPVSTYIRLLAKAGIEVLNVREPLATAAMAAECHRRGIKLFAWGVNDARCMRRVVALGVDGVYSDDVNLLLALSRRRSPQLD